jgi:Ankyrin repeats (3 copies)
MTRNSKLFLFALASQCVVALGLKEIYHHTTPYNYGAAESAVAVDTAPVEPAPSIGSVTKDILANIPGAPSTQDVAKKNGVTPLMQAVISGNCAELESLIRSGENVNAINVNGTDALIYAASSGSVDCVRILLRAGAKLTTTDAAGDSAISAARQQGFSEIVALIEEAKTTRR